MSAQQQHSKIHLCRLAIPDNFLLFYYFYVNPTNSARNSSADGQLSNFPSLKDALPGSTAQAVCDELSNDRSNKLKAVMLLMYAGRLLHRWFQQTFLLKIMPRMHELFAKLPQSWQPQKLKLRKSSNFSTAKKVSAHMVLLTSLDCT